MKIIHLITSLSNGGAQEALYNIINSKSNNFNHVVVSLRDISIYGGYLKKKKLNVMS